MHVLLLAGRPEPPPQHWRILSDLLQQIGWWRRQDGMGEAEQREELLEEGREGVRVEQWGIVDRKTGTRNGSSAEVATEL